MNKNHNMKKVRILFLFIHLHKGGMQRAVSNISQALPSDFEQYVGYFGTENPSFKYNAFEKNFDIAGSSQLGMLRKIYNYVLRIIKLRKFIKDESIDIVVSFGEGANLINLLSFSCARKIVCIRSAIGGYGGLILQSWLIKYLYPFAYKTVAVSNALSIQLKELTNGKLDVVHIPNLYHLDDIISRSNEGLAVEYKFLKESEFILNVGSLVLSKGQNILINAFADISTRHSECKLVIVGRGPEKANYIQLAEQLGIRSRVIFIDFEENPYKYMKLAKLFVFPSLSEGFPNVVIEAMACGCPIVAFDCPTGPREILGDSIYGELLIDFTRENLAERICKLLDSPQNLAYLRDQSMNRALDFKAERVIRRWIDILEESVMR